MVTTKITRSDICFVLAHLALFRPRQADILVPVQGMVSECFSSEISESRHTRNVHRIADRVAVEGSNGGGIPGQISTTGNLEARTRRRSLAEGLTTLSTDRTRNSLELGPVLARGWEFHTFQFAPANSSLRLTVIPRSALYHACAPLRKIEKTALYRVFALIKYNMSRPSKVIHPSSPKLTGIARGVLYCCDGSSSTPCAVGWTSQTSHPRPTAGWFGAKFIVGSLGLQYGSPRLMAKSRKQWGQPSPPHVGSVGILAWNLLGRQDIVLPDNAKEADDTAYTAQKHPSS